MPTVAQQVRVEKKRRERLNAAKEKVVEAAIRWANKPSYESDDRLMLVVRELEEVSKWMTISK